MSVAEEYNDNIFFSNTGDDANKTDFITAIVPTFSILYVPPALVEPTFIANLSPMGQIFARNGELSNFGDNIAFDSAYTYHYSPRLTFRVDDAFFRGGRTRTGLTALGQEPLPTTPTAIPTTSTLPTLPIGQDLTGLVSRGRVLSNSFSAQGAYLATPAVTLTGRYGLTYTNFREAGDPEVANTVGFRGAYAWGREHNLFAGYSVTFFNSRNRTNTDTVVHNFEIGDDYFSLLKFRLTPTLTLSATTGISVNTGRDGPEIVSNSSATLIKVWRTALLHAGVRTGLGNSFGLSDGPAQVTTFFTGFGVRLTERLTAGIGVDYSMVNSEDVDVNVFRGTSSLQYWITTWLSSTLWYGHRWRIADDSTDLVNKGRVKGNSVLLALTAHFDVWPNIGLSKAPFSNFLTNNFLTQAGLPPLVPPDAPEPATPQPPAPESPAPESPGPS